MVTRYEPPPRSRISATELDRRIIEARDLALHCVAAKKIDTKRALLERVRQRLDYWRRHYEPESPPILLDEWAALLAKPWGSIAIFITELSQEATRMRHMSPFDVVVSPSERKRIYSAFAS